MDNNKSNSPYKTSSMTPKDDMENIISLTNEFGYNFDSDKKSEINREDLYLKPKNIVNKDFINRN